MRYKKTQGPEVLRYSAAVCDSSGSRIFNGEAVTFHGLGQIAARIEVNEGKHAKIVVNMHDSGLHLSCTGDSVGQAWDANYEELSLLMTPEALEKILKKAGSSSPKGRKRLIRILNRARDHLVGLEAVERQSALAESRAATT